MEANPVLRRENLARWRGWRAFALMLLQGALAAGAMVWLYNEGVAGINPATNGSGALPRLGHDTFLALTMLQLGAGMLIAPALTATSIAFERERGWLSALQLSQLRAGQISGGKLLSALSLLGLLLLVPLPVVAICFLLGGISPFDFAQMLFLQAATAVCAASIGLWASSRARRPLGALALAYALVALWGFGTGLGFSLAIEARYLFNGWEWFSQPLGSALFGANPFVAAYSQLEHFTWPTWGFAPGSIPNMVPPEVFFPLCLTSELILTLLCLRGAARNVQKPMPDLPPIQDKREIDRVFDERRERLAQLQEQTTSTKAQSALLYELPLGRLLQFANPVLQREVRSKFRPRFGSKRKAVLVSAALLLGAVVYVFTLANALDPVMKGSHGTWETLLMLSALALTVLPALMGAASFTRERESGTWEALSLSLLGSGAILKAKLLAPLWTCLLYGLPFWPLLAACLWNGLRWDYALAALPILAVTAWSATCWGLLISWLCRRTSAAVPWTIVSLGLLLIVGPFVAEWAIEKYLRTFTVTESPYSFAHEVVTLWHPFASLMGLATVLNGGYIAGRGYGDSMDALGFVVADNFYPLLWSAVSASGIALFGAACALVLWRLMRRGIGEAGRKRTQPPGPLP